MNVAVIGIDYVGLANAVVLALMNHDVIGVDIDGTKIDKLEHEASREEDLPAKLNQVLVEGKLRLTTDITDAIRTCKFFVITEPVIFSSCNSYDLKRVEKAIKTIDQRSGGTNKVIIIRSNTPPGSINMLRDILDNKNIILVNNPEFSRKRHVLEDNLNPKKILFGLPSYLPGSLGKSLKNILVNSFYVFEREVPIIFTDIKTSEVVKYAFDTLLITKNNLISRIVSMYSRNGIDIDLVSKLIFESIT